MSEQTIAEVNETVEAEQPKRSPLTPYAAWKVAETVLNALGVDSSKLTPQRMYGMAKRGTIETIELQNDEKVYFDGDSFYQWLQNYINGTAATGGRQNYEKLAEQYM